MTADALPRNLIARETAISIVINSMLSLAFFLLVFGTRAQIAIWGAGNLAFDNAVQAFMIALMSTLVPGMLLHRRLRIAIGSRIAARALTSAVAAAVLAGGLAAAGFAIFGIDMLDWSHALVFKLLLGAAIAAIVTPLGLKAILRAAAA